MEMSKYGAGLVSLLHLRKECEVRMVLGVTASRARRRVGC